MNESTLLYRAHGNNPFALVSQITSYNCFCLEPNETVNNDIFGSSLVTSVTQIQWGE